MTRRRGEIPTMCNSSLSSSTNTRTFLGVRQDLDILTSTLERHLAPRACRHLRVRQDLDILTSTLECHLAPRACRHEFRTRKALLRSLYRDSGPTGHWRGTLQSSIGRRFWMTINMTTGFTTAHHCREHVDRRRVCCAKHVQANDSLIKKFTR